jgi:hypothetical protein
MKYDIFLSYSNLDREWASSLEEALREKGLKVFDMSTIEPGKLLATELEAGLKESKSVVLLVSRNSMNSNCNAVELGAALALKKQVLPVVFDDVPFESLPAPIKRRKFLGKQSPTEVAEKISAGLAVKGNGKKK